MQAKAVAKTVRIAPRKARLVIDLIRGKSVGEAISILRHTQRSASPIIEKVINSAVANAEHNYEMDADNLVIRSEEHTSELQSRGHLVCRLLLDIKKLLGQ